jgi:hypothetical protein
MVTISNAQFLSLQEIIQKCKAILREKSLHGNGLVEDLSKSVERYMYLVYQEDDSK